MLVSLQQIERRRIRRGKKRLEIKLEESRKLGRALDLERERVKVVTELKYQYDIINRDRVVMIRESFTFSVPAPVSPRRCQIVHILHCVQTDFLVKSGDRALLWGHNPLA